MSADQIADTLTAHQRQGSEDCLCGWKKLGHSHTEHQSAMISPLIEAREQEAARKALLDAAYELTPHGRLWWGHGGVKVASEPYAPPTMGLTAWLRARAEEDA